MAQRVTDNRVQDPVAGRQTRQRRAILEALQRLTSHPTATELYEVVRRRLPKISLGTVYRNLDALTRAGAIRKLEPGHGEARFDGDCGRHYHVRCVRCGRLADVHGLAPDVQPEVAARLTGFRILGHALEFVGVCRGCDERARSRHADPVIDESGAPP
jgi:Fur family transcriptional regulator, ferric uptake regulator